MFCLWLSIMNHERIGRRGCMILRSKSPKRWCFVVYSMPLLMFAVCRPPFWWARVASGHPTRRVRSRERENAWNILQVPAHRQSLRGSECISWFAPFIDRKLRQYGESASLRLLCCFMDCFLVFYAQSLSHVWNRVCQLWKPGHVILANLH